MLETRNAPAMTSPRRFKWFATGLLAAAVVATVASVTAWHGQDLYYHHDALALGIAGPFAALVLGVPALWSRTFAINAALFLALVCAIEGLSWVIAPPPPDQVVEYSGGQLNLPDPILGYVSAPNVRVTETETVQGTVTYRVVYETDAFGRRLVPYNHAMAKEAALFLGCSFIFGEGVKGDETAPAAFARALPRYRPYLYAKNGYGPAQALDQFRTRDIAAEVPEPITLVVYYLLGTHVQRVIGTTEFASANWCGRCVNYEGTSADTLIRVGTLNVSRPLTTILQSVLARSNFVRAVGFTFPDPTSETALRRTAAVLEALRDEVARVAPGARFVVAMHMNTERVLGPVRGWLESRGIEVISLKKLYDASDPRYIISEFNHHPSAAAQALIGRALAERLR
jgi:hypothetical protein